MTKPEEQPGRPSRSELVVSPEATGADPARPSVSVVVPCFDEESSLETLHGEICASFEKADESFEVIYVDDGSRDRTPQVLSALHDQDERVEVIRLRCNRGKASALAAGFTHARGAVICMVDADLQDDPAELPPLVDQVRRGDYDLIVGWKKKRNDPFTKVIPSRVFNWMLRRLSPAKLHDFNCGLKVLSADVAQAAPLYGDLYRFLPAFAAAQGFAVTETPVNHRPRKHGHSKYGAGRFLRGFLDLFTVLLLTRFRFRPLHLFGGFGLVLMLLGLSVMMYLSALWFGGETIGNRPLLLFGVLVFLTGVQGIGIGLIAEMIGHDRRGRHDDLTPARRVLSHRGSGDGHSGDGHSGEKH
jgi:glycosyltransferase involved in cell wall biosynthesis